MNATLAEHPAEQDIVAPPPEPWRDIYYTVHDGLRLYARDYGPRDSDRLPIERETKMLHTLMNNSAMSRRRGRCIIESNKRDASMVQQLALSQNGNDR